MKFDIPTCEDCFENINSIFGTLNQEERQRLLFEKTCRVYKKGEIIYHENSKPSGFYCVNKGIVKLFKTGIEGKEQIILFAKKGDIIGYRSILSKEYSCTTAKVIDDAVICFVPAVFLKDLVKQNNNFTIEIMQIACKELGRANAYITDIAQKTVRERLAEALYNIHQDFGVDENNCLNISLTREDIANIVGTATESVIRLMSDLKKEKIIELIGRKIKIIKLGELRKIGNIY